MSDYINNLGKWFKQRPMWIQDAVMRLITKGGLSDDDINQLTVLCKNEVGIKNISKKPVVTIKFKDVILQSLRKTHDLWLLKISDLQGINALAPKKPLEFGNKDAPLTIIYGETGSGKSGYIRLLKHTCGAKNKGILLGNIFRNADEEKKCIFQYMINGKKKETTWRISDEIISDLSSIDIYDNDSATIYINKENEVTYEPWLLALFTQLIEDVCDVVNRKIGEEIISYVSKLPELPKGLKETKNGIWFSNLNKNTPESEVNRICSWNDESSKQYTEFDKRLKEQNPKDKAKELQDECSDIVHLIKEFKKSRDNLSNLNIARYLKAKYDLNIKQIASGDFAKHLSEKMPLDGVGTETWKLLWAKAKDYSEKEVYKSELFPFIGKDSRCVLCQQKLNDNAKERFNTFEKFIEGELEKDVIKANMIVERYESMFKEIPTDDNIKLKLKALKITDVNDRKFILDYCSFLHLRHESVLKAKEPNETIKLSDNSVFNILIRVAKATRDEANKYLISTEQEKRDETEKQFKELMTKKWLYEQKESLIKEIYRLKTIGLLEKAKRLTDTTALSKKKSVLSDKLITKNYTEKFENELEKLGVNHLKINIVKTRTVKGHVYHKIKFVGTKNDVNAGAVLSDGEFRIVSLAAFLADVENEKGTTPFIFDDPITSLDQYYEEATVNRLIELCKTRQVIVFTHRLSLLTMLDSVAINNGVRAKILSVQREPWGVGEPGETPITAQKPERALNSLINECLNKAKKVLRDEGYSEYNIFANDLCKNIRKTLEHIVEYNLLSDVVQRFRRPINTKGKIHNLAKITKDDCIFIDDMMSKYSNYEHLQPKEAPIRLPEPEEIETDLNKIKKWLNKFNKRKV